MSGVLLVGDVIDDVIVRPSGPIAPDTDTPASIETAAGGSAANTACWLVAAGTAATLVATVGRDDLERHRAGLAAAGVRAELAASGRRTGTIVVLSQGSERAMLTDRAANLETGPEQVTDALLARYGALHVTGHVFTSADRDADWRSLLRRARSAGLLVSVAPGSAGLLAGFGADRFRAIVAGADVLIASEAEARLLTGLDAAGAARVLGDDVALAVVTRGELGSVLARSGAVLQLPAAVADPVDVTGAGDAYVAGLLSGLLERLPDPEAAHRAATLAARAVLTVGARPRAE